MNVQRFPSSLQEDWAKWLSCFPWDFFVTLTFKRPVRDVHKAFRRACRWSKYWGFARAVFCAERFTKGLEVHLHGLVTLQEGVRTQDATALWHDWFTKFGICRISALSSRKSPYQATLYVAKYCTKGVDSFEYLLWGARSRWKNLDVLLANPQKETIMKEMLSSRTTGDAENGDDAGLRTTISPGGDAGLPAGRCDVGQVCIRHPEPSPDANDFAATLSNSELAPAVDWGGAGEVLTGNGGGNRK